MLQAQNIKLTQPYILQFPTPPPFKTKNLKTVFAIRPKLRLHLSHTKHLKINFP